MEQNYYYLDERQRAELEHYSLEQCREAIEYLQKRVNHLSSEDYQGYLSKQIKDLGLSTRSYNVLFYNNMTTVSDVLNYGLNNICLLRGCGERSLKEIKGAVLRSLPPCK